MKKELRTKIYNKCDGHCAYCGTDITIKQMQIDHVFPKNSKHYLDYPPQTITSYWGTMIAPKISDIDDESNLLPSCRRCNNYKSSFYLEEFRYELKLQIQRARKQSVNFRNAERFGLLKVIEKPIIFYFEKESESEQD
jgi:5-methylcytosine-specific restriction endonuclease McrA